MKNPHNSVKTIMYVVFPGYFRDFSGILSGFSGNLNFEIICDLKDHLGFDLHLALGKKYGALGLGLGQGQGQARAKYFYKYFCR